MKSKILKTLFIFGLWSIPFGFINKAESITRKYLALGQFDNTEVSNQMFQMASHITYINSFIAVVAIFSLIAIWKPKKAVEQN
jgi:hypothetical protein